MKYRGMSWYNWSNIISTSKKSYQPPRMVSSDKSYPTSCIVHPTMWGPHVCIVYIYTYTMCKQDTASTYTMCKQALSCFYRDDKFMIRMTLMMTSVAVWMNATWIRITPLRLFSRFHHAAVLAAPPFAHICAVLEPPLSYFLVLQIASKHGQP